MPSKQRMLTAHRQVQNLRTSRRSQRVPNPVGAGTQNFLMDVVDQLRSKSPRFVWSPQCKIQNIVGRGTSVVCDDVIPANQVIIRIPPELLINAQTIDQINHDQYEPQELLAHELLVRAKRSGDLWIESLPMSFRGMPLTWDAETRALAPNRARIADQQTEIERFSQKCASEFTHAECVWAWQAVNTRCLYWEAGGMTLAPAVDFVNHTPEKQHSLLVESDSRGITVSTRRSYSKGEELTFCYGPHDNAFLLTEYGFVADENLWDCIDISEEIIVQLSLNWRSWLQDQGYWGEYTLDRQGQPSFRTEVALAASQAPSERVLANMVNGYDDGQRFEANSQRILKKIAGSLVKRYERDWPNAELKLLYAQYVQILKKALH